MSQSPPFYPACTTQTQPNMPIVCALVEPDQNATNAFDLTNIGAPQINASSSLPANAKSSGQPIEQVGEYMEFTVGQGGIFSVGLSYQQAPQNGFLFADYGLSILGTTSPAFAEGPNGSFPVGSGAAGGVFRVLIAAGNIVEFYFNGALVHTDNTGVTGPLYPFVGAQFFTAQNVPIVTGWQVCKTGALNALVTPKVITNVKRSILPISFQTPSVDVGFYSSGLTFYLEFGPPIFDEIDLPNAPIISGLEGKVKFSIQFTIGNTSGVDLPESEIGFFVTIARSTNGFLPEREAHASAHFGDKRTPFITATVEFDIDDASPADEFYFDLSYSSYAAFPNPNEIFIFGENNPGILSDLTSRIEVTQYEKCQVLTPNVSN